MLLEELHSSGETDIVVRLLKKRIAASQDDNGGPRVHVIVELDYPQYLGSGEPAKDGRLEFMGWITAVGDEHIDVADLSWATKSSTDMQAMELFGDAIEVWITDSFPPKDLKSGSDATTFAFNNGGKHGSRRFIPRQGMTDPEIKIEPEHDFIQFTFKKRLEYV